jgi:hypothetical protein
MNYLSDEVILELYDRMVVGRVMANILLGAIIFKVIAKPLAGVILAIRGKKNGNAT